ncbi:hypothetical protein [Nocardia sp. NPDC056000]|uniref:hypothetical protein n=1 Tax=Nocardia sp. NPDC056000 TaxID=3345674 RepID=UPI0035DCACE7
MLGEIAANLGIAVAMCLGWSLVVIAVGLVIGPASRGATHEAEGCVLIAASPGMLDLDSTFVFTATVDSRTCALQSALSRQPLRVQDVPAGRTVELELTARTELSIRARGSVGTSLLGQRSTSWTWELRPSVATSYELSLVVIVRDRDTGAVLDESEPLYLWFDAVPSNLRIVATWWDRLGTIPGAIAALVALLVIAGPLWLRVPAPALPGTRAPESAVRVGAGPRAGAHQCAAGAGTIDRSAASGVPRVPATCGGGIRRFRGRGSPYCRGCGRTRIRPLSQCPRE